MHNKMNTAILGLLSVTLVLSLLPARAAQVNPAKWRITDLTTGKPVTVVTDQRADTKWSPAVDEDGVPEKQDNGILVDLGQVTMVHRIFLTQGDGTKQDYTRVQVTFMQQQEGGAGDVERLYNKPTCEWWKVREQRQKLLANSTDDFLPVQTLNADLKFNPLPARYLRIEASAPIAEMEVYGSADKAAFVKQDAVVLDGNAPFALWVPAQDLRYYLSELTGRPMPLITPDQEAEYPGTLYKIENLAPLAKTFDEMTANLQAGKLPGGVNVEREGRTVIFRAWPYRNAAYSVWEFLRRQGVIWAATTDHAEYVPAGKGVNLGILPLHYQPSATVRDGGANCPPYQASPLNHGDTFYLDDLLCYARNGYGEAQSWMFAGEVPPNPLLQTRKADAKDMPADYREGFEGSPHNLHSVVPDRILLQHPEWCSMRDDGQRVPPSKGGGTFCMTNPELIKFVADKMIYWSGDNPDCSATFRLVPSDAASFCHCPRCTELCQPLAAPTVAYCAGPRVISDPYFYFVSEVAKLVKAQRPKITILSLAYADYTLPPRHLERIPDNVLVQVCLYGARNLPLSSSPANAEVRQYLAEWSRKTSRLIFWDYLLIHSEWRTLTMPVPMVTAIVDREQYLAKMGMPGGLTQFDSGSQQHSPWNHYAHMRMLWDGRLTADQILDEFFTAYYREAKAPMLAYYKALENQTLTHNVSLQDFGYDFGPQPDMLTPQSVTTLRGYLDQAQKLAASWYVKQRVQTARADFEWTVTAALRRSMDAATAVKYGKKQYLCQRRKGAITLDGKLDDAGWQAVPAAAGFTSPGKFEPAGPNEQTEFRLTWDDENLYVAVRCVNPQAATLQPTDNVWGTDNFEFFLAPGQAYTAAYFQTAVSAVGKSWGPKRFFGHMWAADPAAIPPFPMAVARADGYWVCEMAVPFKALQQAPPKAGDNWRVNLVRYGKSWSALPIGYRHLYRDYDLITFVGEGAATVK